MTRAVSGPCGRASAPRQPFPRRPRPLTIQVTEAEVVPAERCGQPKKMDYFRLTLAVDGRAGRHIHRPTTETRCSISGPGAVGVSRGMCITLTSYPRLNNSINNRKEPRCTARTDQPAECPPFHRTRRLLGLSSDEHLAGRQRRPENGNPTGEQSRPVPEGSVNSFRWSRCQQLRRSCRRNHRHSRRPPRPTNRSSTGSSPPRARTNEIAPLKRRLHNPH